MAQHDPKLILPDGEAWLGGDDGIGADKLNKIISKYPMLSLEWLLTGDGEMFKNYSNNTASGTQSIAGHGNTISGNVNITLPEKGYQKIIRADGTQTTVEVAMPYGDNDPRDLAAENRALRKENDDLKNKIIDLQGRLLERK